MHPIVLFPFLVTSVVSDPLLACHGQHSLRQVPPIETRSVHQDARGTWRDEPNFGQYFQQAKVEGTFILYDYQQNQYFVWDTKRANSPIIPASTCKIFNSLVALETGVIQDENEVLKWDGVQRKFPAWNRDQTMRTAIEDSVIWFYQEMARRIGQERMQRYIDLANYGNRNISGGIDQFWLQGGLRITPKEQIDLLVKLHQNKLPFSRQTIKTVKDILINEKTDNYVLRGKTG